MQAHLLFAMLVSSISAQGSSFTASATQASTSSPSGFYSLASSLVASSTATAASASASGSATGTPSAFIHFNCDTNINQASPIFLSTITDLHQASLNGSAPGAPDFNAKNSYAPHLAARALALTSVAVDTYIHVVTSKANAGIVTPAQVTSQIAAMNSAYNPHGISFNLKGSDFTTNDVWAAGASNTDDMAMKNALRQGTYSSLNLYLQSDLAGGVLGKCTLPTNVGIQPAKSVYVVDGCNIAAGTAPAGPIYGYNQGMTAVHETGHWLGLLHTFEGYSCTGSGDFVADTSAEAVSTDGCPMNPTKNTCKAQRSGGDPIHNYMDYSTDACYTKFTPLQEARMKTLWLQFRKGQ